MIPKDPVMLLSFINLKLRDYYSSFEALCDDLDVDGKEITEFKEGHIYRMHAGSAVAGGDGDIPVDPGAIDPVDRCLEITVEVTPWTVVLVKPEF